MLQVQGCVRPSVCTECIVAKGCVLEQKLGPTIDSLQEVIYIYMKSVGTKMNDLDLCLEVV